MKHGRLIDADALKEKAFGKRGGLIHTEDIDNAPTVQPTEASCWGCNCQKMERLKEQKTFSEMVHLHDTETHDKRTETHACDLISRQAAIDRIQGTGYADAIKNNLMLILRLLPSAQLSLKDAVAVIRDFLSKSKFNYTSEFETEDGETLHTDWGYFEDGLNEIERYIERRTDGSD